MKFIFLGYDMMLPVAEKLAANGHEPLCIMSFPCDQVFNFNHNCKALAKHTGAMYIETPVNDIHIDSFIGKGADLFIAAGYPHKIPPIDENKAYGVNLHPSYLPHARGIMPIPYIITQNIKAAAGFTIHKLTDDFDTGDILAQKQIELNHNDCVESYCAKILTKAPDVMFETIANIETLWNKAKAQNHHKASAFAAPSVLMRTLDWSDTINDILSITRAFGRYGCIATINNKPWHIFACDGWAEKHNHPPGTCLTLQNNMGVIAAKDGYIVLKEFRELI